MPPTSRATSAFCCAVAATWLALGTGASAADQPTLDPRCVRLDLEVIDFIESHGKADDLSQDTLGKAGLQFVAARIACSEGRTREGVALYDSILAIEPPVASARK